MEFYGPFTPPKDRGVTWGHRTEIPTWKFNKKVLENIPGPKKKGSFFNHHSEISPTYPWKIPRTFHQQFIKEFLSLWGFGEVWGIFPGAMWAGAKMLVLGELNFFFFAHLVVDQCIRSWPIKAWPKGRVKPGLWCGVTRNSVQAVLLKAFKL